MCTISKTEFVRNFRIEIVKLPMKLLLFHGILIYPTNTISCEELKNLNLLYFTFYIFAVNA